MNADQGSQCLRDNTNEGKRSIDAIYTSSREKRMRNGSHIYKLLEYGELNHLVMTIMASAGMPL